MPPIPKSSASAARTSSSRAPKEAASRTEAAKGRTQDEGWVAKGTGRTRPKSTGRTQPKATTARTQGKETGRTQPKGAPSRTQANDSTPARYEISAGDRAYIAESLQSRATTGHGIISYS